MEGTTAPLKGCARRRLQLRPLEAECLRRPRPTNGTGCTYPLLCYTNIFANSVNKKYQHACKHYTTIHNIALHYSTPHDMTSHDSICMRLRWHYIRLQNSTPSTSPISHGARHHLRRETPGGVFPWPGPPTVWLGDPYPSRGGGRGGQNQPVEFHFFLLGNPGMVIQPLKWNCKVTFLNKPWALVRKYLRLAPGELSASMMTAAQFLEGCHPYTCAASV